MVKRPASPFLDEALFGATPVPPAGPPVAPGVVAWTNEYDDNGAWRGESPMAGEAGEADESEAIESLESLDAAEFIDPEPEAADTPDQEAS